MIDNFWRFALFLSLAAAPILAADDWPMYLYDATHSSFNASESKIDIRNVRTLQTRWITNLSAPLAAAPTISGDVAYLGAWDGNFYAINTRTGAVQWSTYVGKAADPESTACMAAIGVTSQATVVGDVVYVGGGDSAVYALDKDTGSQLQRIPLANPDDGAYLWSSLTLYNNALYIGVASLGDCPLAPGALVRIDLANPAQPLFRPLVPEGTLGGGIWSTPAIDPATNTVYVTTGTGEQDPDSGTWGGAMLALDATTLEISSYYFLPTNSVDSDIEWGSSPTLFQTSDGLPMVAATGKDGVLYAQLRNDLSPAWSVTLAYECICPECGCGSVSTPAFDGHTLYAGAGASPDADFEAGSVYAIDPDNGTVLWSRLLSGTVIAPVTVGNGVLYVATLDGLVILEAATGTPLWSAGPKVTIYSQPVLAGGRVYCSQLDGNVVAWQPAE
jgi:polyvinyl alcohol dehydrogenase (cytochrome)